MLPFAALVGVDGELVTCTVPVGNGEFAATWAGPTPSIDGCVQAPFKRSEEIVCSVWLADDLLTRDFLWFALLLFCGNLQWSLSRPNAGTQSHIGSAPRRWTPRGDMNTFKPLVALGLSIGVAAYALAAPPTVSAVATGEVIINEYASDDDPANSDYLELLVTGSNVDLRGLRISDNELTVTGTLNTNETVYVFGQDAFLSSVPRGTLIALFTTTNGITPDTVADAANSDWRMVLAPGSGFSFSTDGLGGASNLGLATGGEALYVYLPGPNGDSSGTDNVYLDFMSYETDGGEPPTGFADINLPSVADNAYYTGNTADGNDTAANWVRFDVMPNVLATPGEPNPGQDLSTLRVPPTVDAAPGVLSVSPTNGATNVPVDALLSVTFSEPVSASAGSFSLTCAVAGSGAPIDVVVAGGPTVFTLDPVINLAPDDACTLTVLAAGVSDADANDPPDTLAADVVIGFSTVPANPCAAPDVAIGSVQGLTNTSPVSGTVVTVQGVVVGDHEGASPLLRGFYLQDSGDGDPATSDAVFVFNGNNNSVALGQVVQVTGTVAEFQDQTQLGGTLTIASCGQTGDVTPVDVTFPLPAAVNGVAYLERFEGMLVRLPQTLNVTEHFQLGRFGQVTLSLGRQFQPTHVFAPGGPGSDRDLFAQALALSRIILDDSLQNQNPDPIVFARNGQPLSAANTLRGGDTATDVVGVMTYTWAGNAASPNAYRVRPLLALHGAVNFVEANPRPTTPAPIGGSVRAGSMNLLNYFNTFGTGACTLGVGGGATDCRGAENATEFDRQTTKTVAAIVALNPDVLAVNEIENDGYGPTSAIQDLVDRLNAATAPGTYAFVDADAGTGQVNALGVDAIKVGLLYKPAVVTPVGVTAALNTGAFGQIPLSNGTTQQRNRPAFAQSFRSNVTGGVFTIVANHLKSKGSACSDQVAPYGPDPDQNDGQGNCAGTRTAAAGELLAWLSGHPTGIADSDVLIVGDLNSYAKETPVATLLAGGFTDLVSAIVGADAYSYLFDGQFGYLDHALASASLVGQVSGLIEYHINADEPSVLDYNTNFKSAGQIASLYAPDQYRVSDHDPILVGLNLAPPPPVLQLSGSVISGGVQGSPLTLRFSLTSDRSASASLALPLPTGVEFVSATAGGAVSGGSVVWTFAPLSAGTTTVDVVVRPRAYGDLTLAATLAGEGAEVSATLTTSITPAPVTVAAGPDQATPQGRLLTFAGAYTDPAGLPGASVRWTFGDGSSADTLTATHGFSAAGTYTATLMVTTTDGRTGSDTLIVSVSGDLDQDLHPVLVCVRRDGPAQYVAVFGYRNDNAVAVTVPIGIENFFLPGGRDRGQPTYFQAGLVSPAFEVSFRSALFWVLDGNTVVATPLSRRCR